MISDSIRQIRQHGQDMKIIALEGALSMAKTYLETKGDLGDFIAYLEEKIKDENIYKESM